MTVIPNTTGACFLDVYGFEEANGEIQIVRRTIVGWRIDNEGNPQPVALSPTPESPYAITCIESKECIRTGEHQFRNLSDFLEWAGEQFEFRFKQAAAKR